MRQLSYETRFYFNNVDIIVQLLRHEEAEWYLMGLLKSVWSLQTSSVA